MSKSGVITRVVWLREHTSKTGKQSEKTSERKGFHMKRTMTWKTALVCTILLSAVLLCAPAMANHPDGGAFTVGTGDTLIHITIMPTMHDYGTDYEVYTNETDLVNALLGVNLIEGEAVSWGFNITVADGREVNYEEGGYWHIYRDHEILEAGTDVIPIQADDRFMFTLSANWSEDEDGNTVLAENALDLPWPANWPGDIPKMDGRIIAYYGGDGAAASGGIGVGLAVTGWGAAEAYANEAARLGYEIDERESEVFSYLATLTGNGYQITVSQDVECTIHVRK